MEKTTIDTTCLKRYIDEIVVHCSATPINLTFSPAALDADHRSRGYDGCGYHYYITKDGVLHCMRPLHLPGAHVKSHNAHSIGICYEGGLKPNPLFSTPGTYHQPGGKIARFIAADTRTDEQKMTLMLLIMTLRRAFPNARICGHRDLSPDINGDGQVTSDEWVKQCPCFDVAHEYRWAVNQSGDTLPSCADVLSELRVTH